jgi:hypothetical protein
MDGMQESGKTLCAWCEHPATRTILLAGGRGLRMPRTAPVCDTHYEHFTAQDEIGERAVGDSW